MTQLALGESGVDRIARRLSLSRRSLQRRLSEQGTNFERIARSVLRDKAYEQLGRGDRPITDIAFALGYSDPAHFTRAFRQWTGMSPQQWRRAVRADRN